MREMFRGFYALDEDALLQAWEESIIIPDANVLLNLYRYRQATRAELVGLLEAVAPRIRLPHQAALEYQSRRLDVMWGMRERYCDLRNLIDASRSQLVERIQKLPLRLHPALDVATLTQVVRQGFASIEEYLHAKENELPELTGLDLLTGDDIRDTLDQLIGDRVGQAFSQERLEQIYAEGTERYEHKVPPGYQDNNKSEPDRYGDLIFWYQVIEFAVQEQRTVMLITDDQKDDWWWIFKGQRLGPRRELVEELRAQVDVDLILYSPDRFMTTARERLQFEITDDALREVKAASQRASEETSCPHCGWASVSFTIGQRAGESAIPTCPACRFRFHAHRTADGGIMTTRGDLGRRLSVECPSCSNAVPVSFAQGDVAKNRTCLDCYALLNIEPDGSREVIGQTRVIDAPTVDHRSVRCPRCEHVHGTFTEYRGHVYAFCGEQEPALLLRAAIG